MMHTTDFSLSIQSLSGLHPAHTGIYHPDMWTKEILFHEE